MIEAAVHSIVFSSFCFAVWPICSVVAVTYSQVPFVLYNGRVGISVDDEYLDLYGLSRDETGEVVNRQLGQRGRLEPFNCLVYECPEDIDRALFLSIQRTASAAVSAGKLMVVAVDKVDGPQP